MVLVLLYYILYYYNSKKKSAAESRACAEHTSGYSVTSGQVISGSTTSHHLHKCGFVRAHILLTLADIGYPVYALWNSCSKKL
jgi:hypothetical protein